MKPDLVAPGEVVISTASLDVAPACPASPAVSVYAYDGMNHIALRGTSVAAPHMAGAVALLLQKRGDLDPAQVLDYFRTHARHDGFTGATAGNDWGSGKLDLGDLIDPTVSITAPAGGTIARIGNALGVSWSAHDSLGSVANVDVAISRTGPAGPFTTIATAIPNSGSLSWSVTGPQTGAGQAYLRVVAHDTNANTGTAQMSTGFTIAGAAAAVGREPFAFALGEARPNPARGPVSVSYTVGADAEVRLAVEDLQGRRVAMLASGRRAAGRYDAQWGALAPPGLYFLVYDTPAGRFTRRVALAR